MPTILLSNKNITDFKEEEHQLIIGNNLESLVGTTVFIKCPTTGNPAPKIQWMKSGVRIRTNSRLKLMDNTLAINKGKMSDTGSYTCTAINGAGSDEQSSFLSFKGKMII